MTYENLLHKNRKNQVKHFKFTLRTYILYSTKREKYFVVNIVFRKCLYTYLENNASFFYIGIHFLITTRTQNQFCIKLFLFFLTMTKILPKILTRFLNLDCHQKLLSKFEIEEFLLI